jgi:heme exporter protein CcmD
MQWQSIGEFLAMGKHGLFELLAYEVFLICMLYLLLDVYFSHKNYLATLQKQALWSQFKQTNQS